ncbi:MAG: signal recognition particle-docking protein FtsY [Alphaproteobacteria bacterium]|jgi:fused signal recognition particle receptor|nr:signal recognition particle-docking protein FtsY [Alphaproteobacteria bacterium]
MNATSWLGRLKAGLTKTSSQIGGGIADIFRKRRLDDAAIQELEDLLITSDLGLDAAARLVGNLKKTRFGKEVSDQEVRAALATDIADILSPIAIPLEIDVARKPHVVLVVGVNGSGKTTTIGKFARLYKAQGLDVMLAAGDTFRAAAVEQLKIWGERTGCPVISGKAEGDAAGLAYEALQQATSRGADVLLIDTAGRLHNKADLMAGLEKINRVLKKLDESAPHDCLLVLDATIGQNAHNQVEAFRDIVSVSGLVLTKVDGSSKGGVLVALSERFGLPVHAIGVGEGAEDLQPFEAGAYARSLMGLD